MLFIHKLAVRVGLLPQEGQGDLWGKLNMVVCLTPPWLFPSAGREKSRSDLGAYCEHSPQWAGEKATGEPPWLVPSVGRGEKQTWPATEGTAMAIPLSGQVEKQTWQTTEAFSGPQCRAKATSRQEHHKAITQKQSRAWPQAGFKWNLHVQAPGEAAQGPQCSPAFGILSQGPVTCQVLCACSIALCLLVLCSINAINVASAAAPLQCAVLIDMGGFGMGWFFF